MNNLTEDLKQYIRDKLVEHSVVIPGTSCTKWDGAETGATTAQIWFSDNEIMARTVAQCVWFLEHDEDLNGTEFFLVNTCGHKGCTNPDHYEKKEYKNGPRNAAVEKSQKPVNEKVQKVKIIPSLKSKGVFITGSQFAAIKRCPNGYEGEMAKQFRDSGIIITKAMVDKIKEGKLVI